MHLWYDIQKAETLNQVEEKGEIMSTKHEQILRYIESLAVGEKISVRQVAKALESLSRR